MNCLLHVPTVDYCKRQVVGISLWGIDLEGETMKIGARDLTKLLDL